MEQFQGIEQAEQTIREYADFLNQTDMEVLGRLVEQYRQTQAEDQAVSDMMEEGGAVTGKTEQLSRQERLILQSIQEILEAA